MLLDRFLIMMEQQGDSAVVCFNKKDLGTEEELDFLYRTYTQCGYRVILSSALMGGFQKFMKSCGERQL